MVSGEEQVKLMSLTEEIEQHIAAVTAHYQPRLVASARLERGATLWRQFEDSVKAYRASGNVIPVIEKVNEPAVAGLLVEDPTLTGRTSHPRIEDNDRNWNKVEDRQQRHQPGTHYIVGKEWMGGSDLRELIRRLRQISGLHR